MVRLERWSEVGCAIRYKFGEKRLGERNATEGRNSTSLAAPTAFLTVLQSQYEVLTGSLTSSGCDKMDSSTLLFFPELQFTVMFKAVSHVNVMSIVVQMIARCCVCVPRSPVGPPHQSCHCHYLNHQ